MSGDDESFRNGISRRRFVRDGAAIAAGATLSGPAAALAGSAGADTVFRNGRVLTVAGNRVAEAVAVSGDRIAYVGSNGGAQASVGPGTEVIDLRGRTLMPGIHDGHTHPLAGGLTLTKPTLNYRKLDLKQFLKALRTLLARSAEQEPDGWFYVDLWEPSGMDRQPTKRDLDGLPTRRPIVVVDLSGHTAVANSRALELAGITAATRDPQGGKIKRGRRRSPPASCSTTRSGSSRGRSRPSRPPRTRMPWRSPTGRWQGRGSPPTSMRRWAARSSRPSRLSRTADRSA